MGAFEVNYFRLFDIITEIYILDIWCVQQFQAKFKRNAFVKYFNAIASQSMVICSAIIVCVVIISFLIKAHWKD